MGHRLLDDKEWLFAFPEGAIGKAEEVKWCGRHNGRKHCMMCRRPQKYSKWSKSWHWVYLLTWYDCSWWSFTPSKKDSWAMVRANYKWQYRISWTRGLNKVGNQRPQHWKTTGLTQNEFKSLIKKGCKPNKKCKCISLVQRADWYCADCFPRLENFCKEMGISPFHLQLIERDELKQEMLIRFLSGI